MDWFRKRKIDARLKKFFGRPKLKKKEEQEKVQTKKIPVKDLPPAKVKFQALHFVHRKFIEKVPGKTFDDASSFIHALRKRGFQNLGSGAFGTVLGKPGKDRVIKVGRQAGHDGGWFNYVSWANDNGFGGTFAPKIYSHKLIKGKNGSFTITSMERMKKGGYDLDHKEDNWMVLHLFRSSILYKNEMADQLLKSVRPELQMFGEKLKAKFHNHFDIGGNNVMFRQDNSICFTDPIGGGGMTSEYKRIKNAA